MDFEDQDILDINTIKPKNKELLNRYLKFRLKYFFKKLN